MKLKFASFCPLEIGFHLVSFFAEVKNFSFWSKTVDYCQAF